MSHEFELWKFFLYEQNFPENRDREFIDCLLKNWKSPNSVEQKHSPKRVFRWNEIPEALYKKQWIILTSGGIGSTCAFWNIIKSSSSAWSNTSCLFFENSRKPENELSRKKSLEQMFVWSKTWDGNPYMSSSSKLDLKPFYTNVFLSTMKTEHKHGNQKTHESFGWKQKHRISWIVSRLRDAMQNLSDYVFVWGNIDEIELLNSIGNHFNFDNIVLFDDPKKYLLNLCECESKMEQIYSIYGNLALTAHEGALFPRRILNVVCSCEDECIPFDRAMMASLNLKVVDLTEIVPFHPSKHLAKSCGDCSKCITYQKALELLIADCPWLIFGDRERSKLKPTQNLTAKQKNERWILPGRKFIPIKVDHKITLFPWEIAAKNKKKDAVSTKGRKKKVVGQNPFTNIVKEKVVESEGSRTAFELEDEDKEELDENDDEDEDETGKKKKKKKGDEDDEDDENPQEEEGEDFGKDLDVDDDDLDAEIDNDEIDDELDDINFDE